MEVEHRLSDPCAWNERYGEYLFRYAISYVRDQDVAKDLVQETWLAAWQARARFAGQSSERTWLTGILRHKMIDHIQIASRERPLSDVQNLQLTATGPLSSRTWLASSPAWGMDPARQLERIQFWTMLDRCLCRLSDRMKAVFASCDLEEVPYRDVARRLGVTDGHLYVLLHRARQRVRQCLTVHYSDHLS
jgi:RNA polymerase sigma-70 factor (ECF subfamily)